MAEDVRVEDHVETVVLDVVVDAVSLRERRWRG